jgi:hypothetical protein
LERRWPNEYGRTAGRPIPVEKKNKISVAIICDTPQRISLAKLLDFPVKGNLEPLGPTLKSTEVVAEMKLTPMQT